MSGLLAIENETTGCFGFRMQTMLNLRQFTDQVRSFWQPHLEKALACH